MVIKYMCCVSFGMISTPFYFLSPLSFNFLNELAFLAKKVLDPFFFRIESASNWTTLSIILFKSLPNSKNF